MAKAKAKATARPDGPALDPEGHYGPADLVVSSTRERIAEPMDGPQERLPAREVVYRIVRERGPISLEDLAREMSRAAPQVIRPPYLDQPELSLLRLVAGASRELPPLCDLATVVRALAESPGPDPDYGFEVRPAG